jgi:hypothetical protein
MTLNGPPIASRRLRFRIALNTIEEGGRKPTKALYASPEDGTAWKKKKKKKKKGNGRFMLCVFKLLCYMLFGEGGAPCKVIGGYLISVGSKGHLPTARLKTN